MNQRERIALTIDSSPFCKRDPLGGLWEVEDVPHDRPTERTRRKRESFLLRVSGYEFGIYEIEYEGA